MAADGIRIAPGRPAAAPLLALSKGILNHRRCRRSGWCCV